MTAGNLWLSNSGRWRRRLSAFLVALGLAAALLTSAAHAANEEDGDDSIGAHWAAFRLNEADEVDDAGSSEPMGEPTLSTPPSGEPTLSTPPMGEPTPIEADGPGAATPSPEAETLRPTPAQQPEEIGPGMEPEGHDLDLEPIPAYREGPLPFDHREPPAKDCSSGHWLNRGGWYSQIDFSYMNRSGPEDFFFAREVTNELVLTNEFSTAEFLGFEPGMRLTIGEYLCRDGRNRDHAVELTYFGMHDWFDEKGVAVSATGDTFLLTPFEPRRAPGFNGIRSLRYEYGSDFDSLELNLRISRRLGRDRMELNRQGCWVRKCAPGPLSSLIAGFRIASVDERFNYVARNFADQLTGVYTIQTDNDLIGFQSGFDCFWQNCRWRAGVRAKGGAYVNFAEQASQVNTPFSPANNRDEQASKDVGSFIGEVNLIGAYQLRPNVALRASMDLMWINGVALGPEQVNFAVRNPPDVITGGALFYQGGSFGIEMVW